MLLAAETEDHSKCVILTVDKEIEVGTRISQKLKMQKSPSESEGKIKIKN